MFDASMIKIMTGWFQTEFQIDIISLAILLRGGRIFIVGLSREQ